MIKQIYKNHKSILLSIIILFCLLLLLRFLFFKSVELLFLLSGYFAIACLFIKVNVFSRMFSRYKHPEKLLRDKKTGKPGIISNAELKLFFATVPVFIVSGAYFIARLIYFIIK